MPGGNTEAIYLPLMTSKRLVRVNINPVSGGEGCLYMEEHATSHLSASSSSRESERRLSFTRSDVVDLYNGAKSDRNLDRQALKKAMDGLLDLSIDEMRPPVKDNTDGLLVFHMSGGDKYSDESASVWFRLWCASDFDGDKKEGIFKCSPVLMYFPGDYPSMKIRIKKEEKRKEKTVVEQKRYYRQSRSIGDKCGTVFAELVGIGYHLSGESYRFLIYNPDSLSAETGF